MTRDNNGTVGPLARTDSLVVRELEDELLVYDRSNETAHCLNSTAALIWRRCDGRTSVGEIARLVSEDLGSPVDEQVVWYALDSLSSDGLLVETSFNDAASAGLSRRQLLKRAGIAAAVAVPVVTSIVAPTAASAGSPCHGPGGACTTGAQCCSGTCLPGGVCQ